MADESLLGGGSHMFDMPVSGIKQIHVAHDEGGGIHITFHQHVDGGGGPHMAATGQEGTPRYNPPEVFGGGGPHMLKAPNFPIKKVHVAHEEGGGGIHITFHEK